MMAGVAARLLCWQRGLTGWNEARPRVYSHTGESQERGRAGPQARAGSTSQCGGLLASEASWTINRDKLIRLSLLEAQYLPSRALWRLDARPCPECVTPGTVQRGPHVRSDPSVAGSQGCVVVCLG